MTTSAPERHRVLVAGIGNMFLGDDGFGVEVLARLDPRALPDRVDAIDYGIRGVHLAYDLLDGAHDCLVLVDAVPMGETPGALAVLQVDDDELDVPSSVNAHGMTPDAVLQALRGLGGTVDRVLVVGCQPDVIEERVGLSPPVSAALDDAVRTVLAVATDEAARLKERWRDA